MKNYEREKKDGKSRNTERRKCLRMSIRIIVGNVIIDVKFPGKKKKFHTIHPKSEKVYVAIALLFLSAFQHSVVIDFTLTH